MALSIIVAVTALVVVLIVGSIIVARIGVVRIITAILSLIPPPTSSPREDHRPDSRKHPSIAELIILSILAAAIGAWFVWKGRDWLMPWLR